MITLKQIKRSTYKILSFLSLSIVFMCCILDLLIKLYRGCYGVMSLSLLRYHCWSFDIPKDYWDICPWSTSYKEVFYKEFKRDVI